MKNKTRKRGTVRNSISGDVPDLREQLFNQRAIGSVAEVSTPVEQICQLYGILYDIDLKLFRIGGRFNILPQMGIHDFFDVIVRPMIDRHPVLGRMEFRCSGGGLHGILWVDPPILLRTLNEVKRWKHIVRVVQMALPIDPKQPSLNALTRPIGSINSKNGHKVEILKEGAPVPVKDIELTFREMQINAYATIQKIWFGSEHIEPCPVCNGEGSYLEATAKGIGKCYGKCNKVTIDRLVHSVMDYQENRGKEKN